MDMFDFIEDEGVRDKATSAFDAHMVTVNDSIQTKIDKAVSGMVSKNTELLDEKKKIQEKLAEFGDFEEGDLERAKEALAFINGNEDAQLIKDGKIDELIEKRTSQLRSDHDAAVGDLQKLLDDSLETGANYRSKFENKTIDDSLRSAALKAGVLPEAVEDVLLRGRQIFKIGKDGSVEARDADGNLSKTDADMILNPTNWVEGLKTSSTHFWAPSVGSGASGGQGSGAEGDSMAKMSAAVKAGNMKLYRTLRAKQKKKG